MKVRSCSRGRRRSLFFGTTLGGFKGNIEEIMTVLGFYGLLRTLKQQFWGFEMHTGVVLGLDWPKRGFGPDSDPHGSKSGSEGIPWQLFSSRISWQPPNPAVV